MAPRYRKVTVAIWSDARFRALGPLLPSGQALWLYLLTGRETTKIPGLIPAGKHALAESLRWKPEAFGKAWAEVSLQDLARADWAAQMVWIPNAIKHNEPESPNVVRGWRDAWAEIPDCALKHEAWIELKAYLESMGEGFAKAFAEAVREPAAQSLDQPSPNQEQEQEQEQESPAEKLRLVPEPLVDARFSPVVESLFRVFAETRAGSKPTFAKRQGKRVKAFLADHRDANASDVEVRWRRCLALGARYPGTARVELFLDRWDEYADTSAPVVQKKANLA